MTEQGKETEKGTEKRRRRRFSAEKKFQIFLETASRQTAIGEVLRREGLYSADLQKIREQVREGAIERLSQSTPGRKKKTVNYDEYESVKRELERKEHALAEAAVEIMALKKKGRGDSGNASWGND